MTKYQCQNGREEKERPEEQETSKKWVPDHKELSAGSSPHSLWHAYLVPGLLACSLRYYVRESWPHTSETCQ